MFVSGNYAHSPSLIAVNYLGKKMRGYSLLLESGFKEPVDRRKTDPLSFFRKDYTIPNGQT
jgi:hypothetical protein